MIDFYNYLKTQFDDLETAKKWYKSWANGGDHKPIPKYGSFTCRAMAMHISNVLEGKEDDSATNSYIFTKHGTEIYLQP